jgi:hypothetical protein
VSDSVKVRITCPEYECPGHYPWGYVDPGFPHYPSAEANRRAEKDLFLIPREQYERWCRIQEEWEQMNEEMHQITGKV